MRSILTINPKKQVKDITRFIKTTLYSRGFSHVVIGCSGGVDSSTALSLAVNALGSGNVFPLLMPYKNLNPEGLDNAKLVIEKAKVPKVNVEVVDIGPMVDIFTRQFGLKQGRTLKERVRIGNIMARCRMIVLYDRAKKHNALVLGTENKSEYLLSYFTRFGDEASDLEPIRHLYKTQIYQLAKYLSLPQPIIKKKPTAGLWQGQTDEDEFGFTYSQADQILQALYDKRETVDELIAQGFDKDVVVKVKSWLEKNWFKHELPVVYEELGSRS